MMRCTPGCHSFWTPRVGEDAALPVEQVKNSVSLMMAIHWQMGLRRLSFTIMLAPPILSVFTPFKTAFFAPGNMLALLVVESSWDAAFFAFRTLLVVMAASPEKIILFLPTALCTPPLSVTPSTSEKDSAVVGLTCCCGVGLCLPMGMIIACQLEELGCSSSELLWGWDSIMFCYLYVCRQPSGDIAATD